MNVPFLSIFCTASVIQITEKYPWKKVMAAYMGNGKSNVHKLKAISEVKIKPTYSASNICEQNDIYMCVCVYMYIFFQHKVYIRNGEQCDI